jgi:hypothetical protein
MNPPGSSLTSIESIVNSHKEYGKEQLGHYKRYVREHIDGGWASFSCLPPDIGLYVLLDDESDM